MKSIMFNDRFRLTQAVLQGRKTMTRRIEKSLDIIGEEGIRSQTYSFFSELLRESTSDDRFLHSSSEKIYAIIVRTNKGRLLEIKPRYRKGEVVAIAQCYNEVLREANMNTWAAIVANDETGRQGAGFTNKMFVKSEYMPHHIRIENVRIERLQDISDEDCIDEGIRRDDEKGYYFDRIMSPKHPNNTICGYFNTPREAYASLIYWVGGRGTWDSNPFVFVYDFKLID